MPSKKEFTPEEEKLMCICFGYFESALHTVLDHTKPFMLEKMGTRIYSRVFWFAHENFKKTSGIEMDIQKFVETVVTACEHIGGYSQKKLEPIKAFLAPPDFTEPLKPKTAGENTPTSDKPDKTS